MQTRIDFAYNTNKLNKLKAMTTHKHLETACETLVAETNTKFSQTSGPPNLISANLGDVSNWLNSKCINITQHHMLSVESVATANAKAKLKDDNVLLKV